MPKRQPYSDEAWEQSLIADSFSLAERQLRDGTAPAQIILHFLKLGSSRSKLEVARLEQENLLLAAKREKLSSDMENESLMRDAMAAMSRYKGYTNEGDLDADDH